MDKIRTLIGKEWAEVFKNRIVLFSVAFLPLLFVALPIVTMLTTGSFADLPEGEFGSAGLGVDGLCEGVAEATCGQLYIINLYTLMFMILPVAIPVTIAAYSIVGEKTTRSLEPLLATPITTLELLAGKALAAIVPAMIATWVSYLLYVVAMWILLTVEARSYLIDPLWLIAIFVVGPLLTLLSVSVAILISSRVSDPRTAEQLSMIVILPLTAGIVGQSMGLILLDRELILLVGLVVAVLDAVFVYVAVQAFQREAILTRWK